MIEGVTASKACTSFEITPPENGATTLQFRRSISAAVRSAFCSSKLDLDFCAVNLLTALLFGLLHAEQQPAPQQMNISY